MWSLLFKSWAFTSTSNLQIIADTGGATPLATPYVCYVAEFTSASTLDAHEASFTDTCIASCTNPQTQSIGQTVNLAETMEWYKGHVHNAGETTIGSEEYDRARLTSTTEWEWQVEAHQNTGPQTNYLGVVDWNDTAVSVQRGQTTIAASATTVTLTGGTDFTAVDRTRTLLFTSFHKGSGAATSIVPNVSTISVTLDSSGDLVFQREASDVNTVVINWTLVQLPANTVSVQHFLTTLTAVSSTTQSITSVTEANAFVAGTVCSPFGCGAGRASDTTVSTIGTSNATLNITAADEVTVTRSVATGNLVIGYQVVEFLSGGDSSGTIMSSEIDFDWVTGQSTWGNAAFATTETNGDVKLRVYYDPEGTPEEDCDTIVPNGTLSGNSSGFDVSASPVNIAGLTPVASTYNRICLHATLTDSAGTPFLNDWTVTWSSGGAETPTLSQLMRHGKWFNSSGVEQPFTF